MFRSSIKRTTTDGSAESTGRQMEPYRSVFAQTVNLLGKLGIEVSDITGHVDEVSTRVNFAAATDSSGYIGTHTLLYSQPQRPGDPVWKRAHSRYRTLFNDRTGLNASFNTKPVLVQAYRRDMSGDKFALMKDSSAPIVVNGRHWGGLRMAYRPPVA
jgi:hypothetical protein